MKYKLEDICIKITDGSHFSPKDNKNSVIPMYSVKDMREFNFDMYNCKHISEEDYIKLLAQDCVPKKNDILVAKDGSYLKEIFVNEIEDKKAILSSIAIFRPNLNIVNPYFLCYLLKSPEISNYTKENCVSGSAIPRIVLKDFKKIELDIPKICIQNKIVKILKKINEKIIANTHTNNNLQELLLYKYNSYFQGKNANGKLKEIVLKTNRTIKKDKINKSLKYYPIDVLPKNNIILQDGKSIEEAQSSLIEFNKNEILVGAMRVYFHRVCLTNNSGITRNTTFVLKPKDEDYLYYSLLTLYQESFINYANITSKGTTMPYAVWENVCSEFDIYIPTKEELEEFNIVCKAIINKMNINQAENQKLEQIKDTLLPKLMNGEIDLDKIEI